MKPITVAIAGCGSRGQDTYAQCLERFDGRMQLVAAADIRPEKLRQIQQKYGLTDDQCYDSAEKMLAAGAATVHESFEDFSKEAQEQLQILKETSPDALPKASIAVNP